jgi:hypothetical protein
VNLRSRSVHIERPFHATNKLVGAAVRYDARNSPWDSIYSVVWEKTYDKREAVCRYVWEYFDAE